MVDSTKFVLRDPDLHDGYLVGIVLDREDLVLLSQSVDGEKFTFRLSGLERMQANDFRQGNIIFEVLLFTGEDCPDDLLARVSEVAGPQHAEYFARQRERVRTEQWSLLSITRSYGCELLALGRGPFTVSKTELSPTTLSIS